MHSELPKVRQFSGGRATPTLSRALQGQAPGTTGQLLCAHRGVRLPVPPAAAKHTLTPGICSISLELTAEARLPKQKP